MGHVFGLLVGLEVFIAKGLGEVKGFGLLVGARRGDLENWKITRGREGMVLIRHHCIKQGGGSNESNPLALATILKVIRT